MRLGWCDVLYRCLKALRVLLIVRVRLVRPREGACGGELDRGSTCVRLKGWSATLRGARLEGESAFEHACGFQMCLRSNTRAAFN